MKHIPLELHYPAVSNFRGMDVFLFCLSSSLTSLNYGNTQDFYSGICSKVYYCIISQKKNSFKLLYSIKNNFQLSCFIITGNVFYHQFQRILCNEMVFGGRAFGRCLNHEGDTSGICARIKEAPGSSLAPSTT